MSKPYPLLVQVLRKPDCIAGFTAKDWSQLIQQARKQQLLGRLSVLFEIKDLTNQIPQRPLQHLNALRKFSAAQCQSVKWEITQIENSLAELGVPIVILKGAAYCAAELPFAHGRIFSDIDILVPQQRIQEVEEAMLDDGWIGSHHNKYDQHYYRQWMHEIPPMQHPQRKTLLDIHHNIVPLTGKVRVDSDLLLKNALTVSNDNFQDIYRLDNVDMLLHSILHMTLDGEFHNGLRDLVDIGGMLEFFGSDENFWRKLQDRASQLNAEKPLHYAMQLCLEILATRLPAAAQRMLTKAPPGNQVVLNSLKTVLTGKLSSKDLNSDSLAGWLLFLRSHYLKMPLYLLIPHLLVKAVVALTDNEEDLPKEVREFLDKTRRQQL